jgi:hypothetical protein
VGVSVPVVALLFYAAMRRARRRMAEEPTD